MLWETAVVYLAMAIYLAGLALLIAKRVKPARYLLSAAVIPSSGPPRRLRLRVPFKQLLTGGRLQ